MDLHLWLIYAGAALGLSLTPGPNGLLVLTHGIRFGWRRTVATIIGGVVGFLLLIAGSLAGLGALLATSEQAFMIAKWIGAAYLVYLGIRTWRAPAAIGLDDAPAMDAAEPTGDDGRWRRRFTEGFFVAVSNPKALIFFAAFLPQFMQPQLPFWLQFLILGGTFGLAELIYELFVASAAQRIAPWLGRNGRWFNRIAGATFVGIGGLLALARR